MARLAVSVACVLLALVALDAPPLRAGATPPPILVIAHPSLRVASVHLSELRAVYLRHLDQLGGQRVIPLNYPAGDPVRVSFDAWLLHMSESESGRYWVDVRIRGLGSPPRNVTPRLFVRAVASLPGAIGYARPEQVKGVAVKVLRIEGGGQ